MTATKTNIVIEQGATFTQDLPVANTIDLTNAVANAEMRVYYTSEDFIEFVCTVDANNYNVNISLDANSSADANSGRQVWDCKVTLTDGTVVRIHEGIATVTPEATY